MKVGNFCWFSLTSWISHLYWSSIFSKSRRATYFVLTLNIFCTLIRQIVRCWYAECFFRRRRRRRKTKRYVEAWYLNYSWKGHAAHTRLHLSYIQRNFYFTMIAMIAIRSPSVDIKIIKKFLAAIFPNAKELLLMKSLYTSKTKEVSLLVFVNFGDRIVQVYIHICICSIHPNRAKAEIVLRALVGSFSYSDKSERSLVFKWFLPWMWNAMKVRKKWRKRNRETTIASINVPIFYCSEI